MDSARRTKPSAEAVRAFAQSAKVGALGPRPFDGLDPFARIDEGRTFRTNAYERAVLRWASGFRDQSQQEVLQDLIHLLAENPMLGKRERFHADPNTRVARKSDKRASSEGKSSGRSKP